MTSRPILLLTLCLLVTGCASSAQLAQRNEERCTARGLQPKTDAFADCILRLETESEVRKDARHREMMERSSNPFSR